MEEADEAKKFEQYQKEAANGSAEAQYNMGLCYQHGQGVEEDTKQAIEWYTKAV
ncbi:MAG: sel1 repeat family protein [Paludibacteraceae bacterium]|nr:sel1 repeat family protein [Paludibacteraceae bacterium]